MRLCADLHIHSHYSRATSSRLRPPWLDRWARVKGVGLLGTGDCTHARWLEELRENFDDAEEGLYVLKNDARRAFDAGPALEEGLPRPENDGVRFVLTGEISTIYKKDGKTRKVHHLVILPDFTAAAAFNAKLARTGNIVSDGRPILGIDSADLFSLLKETDERAILIPAHIWTPWFSVLGALSGFDSVEECYGSLSPLIPAVETGLSSNPPMNWALSSLDRFSIISNSDAHSPDKIGREATIMEMELSFSSLRDTLAGAGGIISTVEFFPQEGKYHYDGHRKCGVCLDPAGALKSGGICPVCGKAMTRGVMSRVMELADRLVDEDAACPPGSERTNRRPYHSLIPLRELIAEILRTGSSSKKAGAAYNCLIEKGGSEFAILMDREPGELEKLSVPGLSGELLARAVDRMRRGEVSVSAGYDGEYGAIRVFEGTPAMDGGAGLFGDLLEDVAPVPVPVSVSVSVSVSAPEKSPAPIQQQIQNTGGGSGNLRPSAFVPDAVQEGAISSTATHGLIIAGPGTGKTAVLAAKIARLIHGGAEPSSILALSFTVKAAAELGERVAGYLPEGAAPNGPLTATFHSFCVSVLRDETAGLDKGFTVCGEERRNELLSAVCENAGTGVKKPRPRRLGLYIEERKRYCLLPGETAFETVRPPAAGAVAGAIPEPVPELESLYAGYRRLLKEKALLDFDDLVSAAVRLFTLRAEILAKYRRRFTHIFVDEYQDINLAQYALIKLLAPAGGTAAPGLWVIGDPNQAIYGFRGSDNRFIRRFRDDYPGAACFEMRRSFRCACPIIRAAGRLTGAGLEGVSEGDSGTVDLYRTAYPTDKSEAEGIARTIAGLIGGTSFFAKDSNAGQDSNAGLGSGTCAAGLGPSDCAVLVRAAALAEPVIKALTDHGIPYEFEDPGAEELDIPDSKVLAALRTQGVRVMTIHASKGLEFDQVFIAGLEDGILPFTLYDREESANDLEEERRILYVAMTRARHGLRLSWAASRLFNGRRLVSPPSRFLSELEHIIPLAGKARRPFRKDPQLKLF
ncbi:MAG: UvrD-helicase domain-containing protein [Treponema sp.]|jgi:uncharacterized protein (TIGR00375 family)|nr:UvrD-helicase domain-containing protein [Treponema sp.]